MGVWHTNDVDCVSKLIGDKIQMPGGGQFFAKKICITAEINAKMLLFLRASAMLIARNRPL